MQLMRHCLQECAKQYCVHACQATLAVRKHLANTIDIPRQTHRAHGTLHIFESCGLARGCTTSQPSGQTCVACTSQAQAHAQTSCMLQPRAWLQHAHVRTSCPIPAWKHQVCPQASSKADWLVWGCAGLQTHKHAHTTMHTQLCHTRDTSNVKGKNNGQCI